MDYKLAGRYKIEAVKADGERRLIKADWFNNLILDSGLNRLGSGGAYSYCMVGTGTAAAAISQTALAAQIANTNNQTGELVGVDTTNGFAWNRRTFRFGLGAAAGNLTEVGVGWTSTDCFSRALITDSNGNPVSITVLADEYLDVTYELRLYWPTADVVASSVNISGSTYTVTARPAVVGSWAVAALINNGSSAALGVPGQATSYTAGTLGDNTVEPGGVAEFGINMTYAAAYTNNSLQRDYRGVWDGTKGSNPIGAIRVSTPFGIYKFGYSPSLPKGADNTMTLDFRMSWARFTEYVGVNTTIGNLSVDSTRVASSGSISCTARVEFRTDGTIWAIATNNLGVNTTSQLGRWHLPVTAGIGTNFQVQFSSITGAGGTFTSNANGSYTTMAADVYADLTQTSTGAFDNTRTMTYSVRAATGGAVLSTGTLTLHTAREI